MAGQKENQCSRKQRHETREGAEAHMRQLEENKPDGRPLGIYWCRFCRGWHVGHRKPHSTLERKRLKRGGP